MKGEQDEITALWDAAVLAWKQGWSTEDYEAAFAELLDFVLSHPEAMSAIESRALDSLVHPAWGAPDLVGYLMHTLRSPIVHIEAKRLLAAATDVNFGAAMADVVSSFDDDWADRDLYERYSQNRGRRT